MANKPVAVYNPTSGLIERLKTGDTPVDSGGNPIGGGGATAAGLAGQIQYKGVDGDLAASSYLSVQEVIYEIQPISNAFQLNINYGDTATLFTQTAKSLNVTSTGGIGFISDTGLQFGTSGDSSFTLNDDASSFDAVGTLAFSSNLDLTFNCAAGPITLSVLTAPAGTDVPGYGQFIKCGNSRGNQGSTLDIWTALFGGSSGSSQRMQAKRFTFYGNKFGVGVVTPLAAIHAIQTTEQLRLGYDASNYSSFTIGSTGALTWTGTGNGASFTLTPASGQNAAFALGGAGLFKVTNGTNDQVTIDATGSTVINEQGDPAGDFRAESDTESNMIFLDASTDTLYLGGTTNGISITKGGALTLLGTAKTEHHTQVPVMASIVSGSGFKRYGTTCVAGALANQNTDLFFIELELWTGWDGQDVYFEIDWLPDSSLSVGQTVIWNMAYRSIAEGEVVDNLGEKTLTLTYTSPTGGTLPGTVIHTRFTLAYNDATSPLTVEDHNHLMVWRNATSDTYNGDCIISNFEFIWYSNKFSRV